MEQSGALFDKDAGKRSVVTLGLQTAKPLFGVALNSVGSLRTPTLIRPDNQRAGWLMSHKREETR